MDHAKLIATAQDLLRQLQEPGTLQRFETSLAALAELLRREGDLARHLIRVEHDVKRAEAESASRVEKCQQRELIAQRQHQEATDLRNRELTALDERITALKTDIAALTEERQGARRAIEVAQAEHHDVLAGLAVEHRAATQALEATRASLAKLREAIPA